MAKLESQFRRAAEACPALSLCDGLQALSRGARDKIRPRNTRSVTGSVDIDKDLKNDFPEDNRWDYAVGYRCKDKEKVFFVEVHPAQTSEITCVIRKAKSLKAWAETSAPELWNMTVPREIHWVASDKCNLRLNDSYRRQLALCGVGSPKQSLILE